MSTDMWKRVRFALLLTLLLSAVAGCTQTVDFDVKVIQTIDMDDLVAPYVQSSTSTINIPGGVEIPISAGEVTNLSELDNSFSAILGDGSEIELLSIQYQVISNTSNTSMPSLRLSAAPMATAGFEDSVLVARLPVIPPRTRSEIGEVPWVPQGRDTMEEAMQALVFTTFTSGTLVLEEGDPVPTGELEIHLTISARTVSK
ncbi:MAG: hypothetical protein KC561_17985 [Myxococcales bacterium]|nr:hypothetical protein [Myxococcales bacterium]